MWLNQRLIYVVLFFVFVRCSEKLSSSQTSFSHNEEENEVLSLIVFADVSGALCSIRAEDGKLQWRTVLPDVRSRLRECPAFFEGKPTVLSLDGGQVEKKPDSPFFIPSFDGSLFSPVFLQENANSSFVDPKDTLFKKLRITANDIIQHSPFIDKDGNIFIGSKLTEVFKIDMTTGQVLDAFSSLMDFQVNKMRQYEEKNVVFVSRIHSNVKVSTLNSESKWNFTISSFQQTISFKSIEQFPGEEKQLPIQVALSTDNEVCRTDMSGKYVLWSALLPLPAKEAFYFTNCADCWSENDTFVNKEDFHHSLSFVKLNPNYYHGKIKKSQSYPSKDVNGQEGLFLFVGQFDNEFYAIQAKASPPKQFLPKDLQVTLDFSDIESSLVPISEAHNMFRSVGRFVIENELCQNDSCGITEYFDPSDIARKKHENNSIETQPQPHSDSYFNQIILIVLIVLTIITISVIVFIAFLYNKIRLLNKKEKVENTIKNEKVEAELEDNNRQLIHVKFDLSDVIGQGNMGTIVYSGEFNGRKVAIKRLLKLNNMVAQSEIALLAKIDEHPNIVRYYFSECDSEFIYLVLTLCKENLSKWVYNNVNEMSRLSCISKTQIRMMHDFLVGLSYLHSLKIIHRDIKPDNILIDYNDTLRISDMGIAKTIDGTHASITHAGAGSIGWQPPEILRLSLQKYNEKSETDQSFSFSDSSKGNTNNSGQISTSVDTFAAGCVIFFIATGCHPFGDRVEREMNILTDKHFLYEKVPLEVLTKNYRAIIEENNQRRLTKLAQKNANFYLGKSPSSLSDTSPRINQPDSSNPSASTSSTDFDNLSSSDSICNSSSDIVGSQQSFFLSQKSSQNLLFTHLTLSLIHCDPKKRSTATEALSHPFFWDSQKFLQFFSTLSDRMEVLPRKSTEVVELEGDNFPQFANPTSKHNQAHQLSDDQLAVFFNGQENIQWQTKACAALRADLSVPIRRRYNFNSWRDLLRMIRNKINHYYDQSPFVRQSLGSLPDGVFEYLTERYPSLCIRAFLVALRHFSEEKQFSDYFQKFKE